MSAHGDSMQLPSPSPSQPSGPVNKDATTGKPRRPHNKSRTGCVQCKQRKIKCDETKPVCKKCENHNQSCSYLQTHPLKRSNPTVQSMLASPSPTSTTPVSTSSLPPQPSSALSPPTPAYFTMLDLEILHHWTTRSVESFVDFESCVTLFKVTVVEMGFEYPFLMHEILAITALHMSRVKPQKASTYRHASDTHLATALALFQPQMARLNLSNCHACWAFSTMIFTHGWASQDANKPSTLFFTPPTSLLNDAEVHVQWVKLHRGSQVILHEMSPQLQDGPMEPLFTPWKNIDPEGSYPLLANEEELLSALPATWIGSPRLSISEKNILAETHKHLRRIFSLLTYNPEISKLSAVMSWFSMISDGYLALLEQKLPEALLIVAYYCVALKRAENMWWVKTKGENLLKTVILELGGVGGQWDRWTRWPVEQVLSGESKAYGFWGWWRDPETGYR